MSKNNNDKFNFKPDKYFEELFNKQKQSKFNIKPPQPLSSKRKLGDLSINSSSMKIKGISIFFEFIFFCQVIKEIDAEDENESQKSKNSRLMRKSLTSQILEDTEDDLQGLNQKDNKNCSKITVVDDYSSIENVEFEPPAPILSPSYSFIQKINNDALNKPVQKTKLAKKLSINSLLEDYDDQDNRKTESTGFKKNLNEPEEIEDPMFTNKNRANIIFKAKTDEGLKIDEHSVNISLNKSKKSTNLNFLSLINKKPGEKLKYDIDEILSEEKLSFNKYHQNSRKIQDLDTLLDEHQASQQEHLSEKRSVVHLKKNVSKAGIDDLLSTSANSLSLEESNSESIQNEVDSLNINNKFDMNEIKEDYSIDNVTKSRITDNTSRHNLNSKKGTEWLKEAKEKIQINNTLLATTSLMNNTTMNLNDTTNIGDLTTVLNTTRKISPTMLTTNTSSMFLNENDIKKRKVKYVK
jgi:hypothetical protein